MTTSETSETTLPPPLAPTPARRRRWPTVLLVVLVLLLGAIVASLFINLPEYALVPGQAQSVAPAISVPPGRADKVNGHVLLTDVGVENVRLFDYLPDLFSSDTDLVPQNQLTGNLPLAEYDAEGTVDMQESQLAAEAVSLRQLGYRVPERDAGVTIYILDPKSAAYHRLQVGDVVTAVDDTAVTNPDQLSAAIRAHRPGDVVTVHYGTVDDPGLDRTVRVPLGSGTVDGQREALLGIGMPGEPWAPMGTQPAYTLPFKVNVNVQNIGGPSAGLAFTLGIIDQLAGGDITGGRTVAATGVVNPDGSVGPIGGIVQKTVAVENAGASVFFVPDGDGIVAAAKAHDNGKVTIIGVKSVRQALEDLQRLGGHLGRAAAGPPAGPGGDAVPYGWQSAPWNALL